MDTQTKIFFASFGLYVLAFITYTIGAVLTRPLVYSAGRLFCFLGAILATVGLILRWISSGYPPLSNMHESMYTLTTIFVWIALFFTRKESFPLIEGGSAVLAILMTGIGSVFANEIRPLVPALRSYWLHLHVSLTFVGEACFALAFVLSYLFLLREVMCPASEKSEKAPSFIDLNAPRVVVYGLPIGFLAMIGLILRGLASPKGDPRKFKLLLYGVFIPALLATILGAILIIVAKTTAANVGKWLPSGERLDELSYKTISLGYPVFTVGGIIFGMVWANKAWGRYWGWDPKETWALITFLVYSGYLHIRMTKGWKGTVPAVLSITGFLVTMFTLFGVNLILSGLHSYGSS